VLEGRCRLECSALNEQTWDSSKTLACRPCFRGMPGRSGGRPIQYVHVPKTGGSSVRKLLLREVTAMRISHEIASDNDNFIGKQNTSVSTACVVLGHAHLGWGPDFLRRRPLYIATFRDPVGFAVSQFDYVRYRGHARHDPVRDRAWAALGNRSLTENVLARNPVVLAFVRDKQASFLFGSSFARAECARNGSAPASSLRAPVFNLTTFYDAAPILGGGVACALHLLDAVDVVGVTEALDDLLVQLRWRTGWVGMSARGGADGALHLPHSNHIDPGFKSVLAPAALAVLEAEAAEGIDRPVHRRAQELNAAKTAEAFRCLSRAPRAEISNSHDRQPSTSRQSARRKNRK